MLLLTVDDPEKYYQQISFSDETLVFMTQVTAIREALYYIMIYYKNKNNISVVLDSRLVFIEIYSIKKNT